MLWSALLIWTADSGYTFMDAVSLHNSLIFVSVLWWIFNIRNRFYNNLWYILIRDMFFSASSLLLTAYQVFLAGNTIPITLILIWILTFPLDSPCLSKITFSSFSCNIYILWIEWMSLFQITFSVIFCFLVFFLMSLYYHRGFYLSILFCIFFHVFHFLSHFNVLFCLFIYIFYIIQTIHFFTLYSLKRIWSQCASPMLAELLL